MDLKDILQSLKTISEATKETEKGRVHKADPGGYGRKFDTDEEGEEKSKKAEPAEKKGRGRPKKDDGDKKYDTETIGKAFGVGKAPKKPIGQPSKKHTLKDWIEQVESNQQLNEAEQVTIQPAQANTQVIKQGNKTLGTVTNPQLAQQIKQSIGRGEMTLAGDKLGQEMEEATGDYSAKKARAGKDIGKPGKQFSKIAADAAKRYGSKERGEKVAGAVLAKLRAKESVEEDAVEESGLQAYLGNKKYGKDGMDALRKAGREGASKEQMANIRAKYDKMDETAEDEFVKARQEKRHAQDMMYAAGKGSGQAAKDVFAQAKHGKRSADDTMYALSKGAKLKENPNGDGALRMQGEVMNQPMTEKAVSKAQQKFMGMVHAAQKGEKPASKAVADVAKSMGKKDAKDFAATKHKGLPEKVKKTDEAVRGYVDSMTGVRPPQSQSERDQVAQQMKANRATNRADTTVSGYGSRIAPQQGVASAGTAGGRGAISTDQFGQSDFDTKYIDKRYGTGTGGKLRIPAGAGKGVMDEENNPALGKDAVSAKERLAPHAGMGKGPIQQKLGQAGVMAKNIGRFLKGKPEIPTMENTSGEETNVLIEGVMKDLVTRFIEDLTTAQTRGFNINNAVELQDLAAAKRVINNTLEHGDRYKRLAGTLKGQLRDYALEEFGFTDYDMSLEEADTRPELETTSAKLRMAKTTEPEISPFTAGAPTLSLENDMKDIQFENWEKQLNTMLTEGLTISSSTGQQGSPDSVTISASDNDAQELLNIVRKAGLGVFGHSDSEVPHDGHDSALMSVPSQEPDGHGTEPEASPEVVGDGDDMLALIKKMTGLGQESQPVASHDYEEEDEEGEEEDSEEDDSSEQGQEDKEEGSGEESEEEGEESEEEVDEAYGQADEGNAFTGALAKAKKDGIQKGETMKVGGKTYPVKEDDMEEGNAFTGQLAKTPKGGEFELDGKKFKDTSNLDEESLDQPGTMDEEMCNECGMYESKCGCEETVEEAFANDAGGDAMADTELAKLKELLAMGNDLHKMKRDQTVLNPTQVTVRESLYEWKKLSGIK